MLEEIWKDIDGYEGVYMISNHGRIRSMRRIATSISPTLGIRNRTVYDRILKQGNTRRYKSIKITHNGVKDFFLIHRLVGIAFVSNPNNLNEIDYIDGNTENNYFENIRWVTHRDNMRNEITRNKIKQTSLISKAHTRVPVLQFDLSGNLIAEYESNKNAAKLTGVRASSIYAARVGTYKTAGGYIWKTK